MMVPFHFFFHQTSVMVHQNDRFVVDFPISKRWLTGSMLRCTQKPSSFPLFPWLEILSYAYGIYTSPSRFMGDFQKKNLHTPELQSHWLNSYMSPRKTYQSQVTLSQELVYVGYDFSWKKTESKIPTRVGFHKWVFPQIMVPQIIHFYRVFHYKPLNHPFGGVLPLFLETSKWQPEATSRCFLHQRSINGG